MTNNSEYYKKLFDSIPEDVEKDIHSFVTTVESKFKNPKGKYAIINILTMDYMKDEYKLIELYDTLEEAQTVCGMYEFENVWIVKLIENYRED